MPLTHAHEAGLLGEAGCLSVRLLLGGDLEQAGLDAILVSLQQPDAVGGGQVLGLQGAAATLQQRTCNAKTPVSKVELLQDTAEGLT